MDWEEAAKMKAMQETINDMLAALGNLSAECRGILAFEPWVRKIVGNTNVNCLRLRLDEARAAIAKAKGK